MNPRVRKAVLAAAFLGTLGLVIADYRSDSSPSRGGNPSKSGAPGKVRRRVAARVQHAIAAARAAGASRARRTPGRAVFATFLAAPGAQGRTGAAARAGCAAHAVPVCRQDRAGGRAVGDAVQGRSRLSGKGGRDDRRRLPRGIRGRRPNHPGLPAPAPEDDHPRRLRAAVRTRESGKRRRSRHLRSRPPHRYP